MRAIDGCVRLKGGGRQRERGYIKNKYMYIHKCITRIHEYILQYMKTYINTYTNTYMNTYVCIYTYIPQTYINTYHIHTAKHTCSRLIRTEQWNDEMKPSEVSCSIQFHPWSCWVLPCHLPYPTLPYKPPPSGEKLPHGGSNAAR